MCSEVVVRRSCRRVLASIVWAAVFGHALPVKNLCAQVATLGIIEGREFRLIPVRAVGWASEQPQLMAALPPSARAAGGGTLAQPRQFVEDRAGDLWVLDSEYRKIVRFGKDGTVRQVVLGGYGMGPTEFVRPRGLALDRNGHIYVLDAGQSRITVFDTMGRYVRSRSLPFGNAPLGIAAIGNQLYVLRHYSVSERALFVIDETLTIVDSAVAVTPRMREFAQHGSVGSLAVDSEDQPILVLPFPGLWRPVRGEGLVGMDLAPRAHGRTVRSSGMDARLTDAGTRGMATLADGHGRLILYYELDPRRVENGQPLPVFKLALISHDGTSLRGVLEVPFDDATAVASSGVPGHIWLGRTDPFPQVVLYRVEMTK